MTNIEIRQKLLRVYRELREGMTMMQDIGPSVTVFGSARTSKDTTYYKKAFLLGHKLANAGFNVVSGGGPGIMQASNRGAFLSGNATSVGMAIDLKLEKGFNDFINKELMFDFFFTRKYIMTSNAFAFVVFPGGLGTLDELFEILTLIQTGKGRPAKIFLVGVEFYTPLVAFMRNTMVKQGMIDPEDMDLFELTDDVGHITDQILSTYTGNKTKG